MDMSRRPVLFRCASGNCSVISIRHVIQDRDIDSFNFPCGTLKKIGLARSAAINLKKGGEDRLGLSDNKTVNKGGYGLGVQESGYPSGEYQGRRLLSFKRPLCNTGGFQERQDVWKVIFKRDGKGDDVKIG